jgi:hemerythrin-like metal-binding protein
MVPARVEWDHRLAIGVGGLDDAHKELVDLYNRIVWACERDASISNVRERIRSFLMYARWHFGKEEEHMRRVRYSGYVDHKADHKRLLDDAGDFVESLGGALTWEDGPAIISYFEFWLTRHLASKDAQLRDFLNNADGGSPA